MLSMILFVMNKFERDQFIDTLYRKYATRMLRYSGGFFRNKADAEEVIQEVFIKLIDKADDLSEMSDKQQCGYISSCIRNTSINDWKKENRKLENEVSEAFDEEKMTATYDDYKFVEEDQSYVNKAIEKLRPNYRMAVLLKYNSGYTYEEIAKEMGISTKHVGVILSRAKEKIKKAIVEMKQNDKER